MPNTRVNRGNRPANINHKPERNKSAWNFSIYSCVRVPGIVGTRKVITSVIYIPIVR